MPLRILCRLFLVGFVLSLVSESNAQPTAPLYEECRLDSIFPNGAQRGTSVQVEFKGVGSGLSDPIKIVIDGPRGVTARDLKSINGSTLEATLDIAAEAPLGRRLLRVLNQRSGITNFAYFVVGGLPETIEVEPNNEASNAQHIRFPEQANASRSPGVVINGRITPAADLDVFQFKGKAGQKLVAAIAAHALDVHGQYKDAGIADFNLELLDHSGRTIAAAEDSAGFDPIIEQTLPSDGDYLVRVQLLNYAGFPAAVYRLTLGEVPYPTGVFPAGYQRGTNPALELLGANFSREQRTLKPLSSDSFAPSAYVLRHVGPQLASTAGLDVPLIEGDLPEVLEVEPNNDRATATELKWPTTANGRFLQSGDTDWYRIRLEAQQRVSIEVNAHRYARSPVDTLVQVFDTSGNQLAENDDFAFEPGYESFHDFKTTDSQLLFTAPITGEYFLKITEHAHASGPRMIYRLTVKDGAPDFFVSHFPDAVPIWDPGSTACVLVRVDRFGGFDEDVVISAEGLPTGWSSSTTTSLGNKAVRPYNTYQLKVFLTITAPADSTPGTHVPIRLVAKASSSKGDPRASGMLVRDSLPLSLFYTSDVGYFRPSPQTHVVVTKSQGPWLETLKSEVTLKAGTSTAIPVRVHNADGLKEMPTAVNIATAGVACGLMTPINLPITPTDTRPIGTISVPLRAEAGTHPGSYGITVSQTWRGDIRVGMPGPCTPLIKLIVTP